MLLLPGVMSLAKDSSEAVARHKGEVETIILELESREDCDYESAVEEPEEDREADGDDGDGLSGNMSLVDRVFPRL
ncbi:MAG: hypothetical protein OXU70_12515 [Gammaproteobacteria bacterium]|nr:hypothetical protein [Gammaproteobacteria bacterium]